MIAAKHATARLDRITANGMTLADLAQGEIPDEARFVRMIGCPETRQFELLELGYQLFLREVPTVQNPNPGTTVGRLWAGSLLKALAVDVLKANDAIGDVPVPSRKG
ncbi:MAG: hypothetical protein AAFO77_00690 [Pseudomonadota bacterium]